MDIINEEIHVTRFCVVFDAFLGWTAPTVGVSPLRPGGR